jgi:hypothetical protein
MVPCLQHGQRERSTPVIFKSTSLADSMEQRGKAGSRWSSLRHWGSKWFFCAVGQKTKVADAHEPIRQDVEQKAADKFLGIEGHGLFAIAIFSISIAQGNLALIDSEDAIIRQRHAVSVAAEIIEDGLGRTERVFA